MTAIKFQMFLLKWCQCALKHEHQEEPLKEKEALKAAHQCLSNNPECSPLSPVLTWWWKSKLWGAELWMWAVIPKKRTFWDWTQWFQWRWIWPSHDQNEVSSVNLWPSAAWSSTSGLAHQLLPLNRKKTLAAGAERKRSRRLLQGRLTADGRRLNLSFLRIVTVKSEDAPPPRCLIFDVFVPFPILLPGSGGPVLVLADSWRTNKQLALKPWPPWLR